MREYCVLYCLTGHGALKSLIIASGQNCPQTLPGLLLVGRRELEHGAHKRPDIHESHSLPHCRGIVGRAAAPGREAGGFTGRTARWTWRLLAAQSGAGRAGRCLAPLNGAGYLISPTPV